MIGYVEVPLAVSDTDGETDNLDITILIKNENDPPEIIRVKGNTAPENKLIEFIGSNAIDPYGQLEFSIEASDIDLYDNLTFDTENKSLKQGYSPELVISQTPGEKTAKIIFDPLAKRADSVVWFNITVEDNGYPVKKDWLKVRVKIKPEPYVPPKYSLNETDCARAYSDEIGDVFVYDKNLEGGISTSKGDNEFNSIDIMTIESSKIGDDLVIVVKFKDRISESLFTDVRLYVVKQTFSESGTHLTPKDFEQSDWTALPYEPPDDQIISGGFLFEYFEISSLTSMLLYDSTVESNVWTITISLEGFENNFNVDHENNNFEFFVRCIDTSQMGIVTSGDGEVVGPKAYDSAGFGAAAAPEPIKAKSSDPSSSSEIAGLAMGLFLLILIPIIIFIIVILLVVVFLKKRKRQAMAPTDAQGTGIPGPDGQSPPPPPTDHLIPQVPCSHCGATLRPGDTYCPRCGEWPDTKPKEVELKCENCGMNIPEGRYVCPICSTPISIEKLQPEPAYPGQPMPAGPGPDQGYGYGQGQEQYPAQYQPGYQEQAQVSQEIGYAQVQEPYGAPPPQQMPPQPPQEPGYYPEPGYGYEPPPSPGYTEYQQPPPQQQPPQQQYPYPLPQPSQQPPPPQPQQSPQQPPQPPPQMQQDYPPPDQTYLPPQEQGQRPRRPSQQYLCPTRIYTHQDSKLVHLRYVNAAYHHFLWSFEISGWQVL
jgi:hypothetical protein